MPFVLKQFISFEEQWLGIMYACVWMCIYLCEGAQKKKTLHLGRGKVNLGTQTWFLLIAVRSEK